MAAPWWKSAVFYLIYTRSFLDTDGDGVGDLEGIRRRLDYLAWLGVDALWLCPFYPSPMADFGYDVSDYTDVDPTYGTLEDFDRLLADAHQRGMRVLIDWVPNHTSDRHPWFVESRSSRDNPKRDWYVWRDRPNNWKAAFGGDAWTFDETTGQWYLHLFLPGQPDLDWRNPEVADALHETLRFWLDRGVDGFRIDVVQGLTKDPDLPDDPPGLVLPHCAVNDCVDTHDVLRGIRRVADAYGGERVLVGEVYLLSTRQVARYLGPAATSCTWRSTSRCSTPRGMRRPGGAGCSGRPRSSMPSTPGPRGTCRTSTTPATAPATGRRRGPGRRRFCC